MTQQKRPIVLCVDDEARVVDSLALSLRKDYDVHTALSGEAGLQKLKELRDVAVVVSDMRMPSMDGATFLKRVMRANPDCSRILLTGETGRDAAVLAINEGQIFRFLTKPCPPDQLKAAIDAAVIQYRLVNAERAILQETVIGCIQVLIDVQAITNPVVFARASRVKRLAMNFSTELGCSGYWQLEAAAMLSQLGYLSLPVELVEKVYDGERLTPEESLLVQAAPEVSSKLLGHIPRLEPVIQILAALHATDNALRVLGEGTIGLGAKVLALVLDYDSLLTQGHSSDVAMQSLRTKSARYGEALIDKFAAQVGVASATSEVREMQLRLVKAGMTIMTDVRTHLGTLLIARGFEVTESFLVRVQNFGDGILDERVKVLIPAAPAVEMADAHRGAQS